MPSPISTHERNAIISDHFQGSSNEKIADRVHRGTGTVSREIGKFKKETKSKGLETAAEEYGVSQIVEELHELSVIVNKNNMAPIEAIVGAKIAANLKHMNIDLNKINQFIEQVHNRSIEKKYSPTNIIDDCITIQALERKYGNTFDEIKKQFDNMGSRLNELRKEIQEQNIKNEETKMRYINLFDKYETDQESLEQHKNMKNELTKYGLSSDDLEKVVKVLSAIKKEDYNIKPIIDRIEELENLEGQKYLLNEDIKILNNEVNQFEQDKQEITTKICTLKKRYETRTNQITRYHNLLKKDVTDEQIIFWENIITSTNLNSKRIEEELLSQQNLMLSKEEIRKKTRDLKQTEKELTVSINKLISNKKVIEKTIETIQQTGINKINEATESTSAQATNALSIMNQTIEEIQTQTQEALKKSEIINQKILGKTENSIKNTADNLEKISKQINAITDETVNAIDKISNLHPISDAYRFLDTGKGEPETVIPLAVNFLLKLKSWGKDRNKLNYSLEMDINHLMDKLEI